MNWESVNVVETWRRFKQHVKRMFSGPLREKSEAEKCGYLLIWVGEKGRVIFNTWTKLEEGDRNELKPLHVRFKQYVSPKANPIFRSL